MEVELSLVRANKEKIDWEPSHAYNYSTRTKNQFPSEPPLSCLLLGRLKRRLKTKKDRKGGKIDFLYTTRESPPEWDWKCSTYMSVPRFFLLFDYF